MHRVVFFIKFRVRPRKLKESAASRGVKIRMICKLLELLYSIIVIAWKHVFAPQNFMLELCLINKLMGEKDPKIVLENIM